jgi:hypothetical protein
LSQCISDREWLVPVSVIVSVEMLLWVIAFLAGTAYAPLFTTYGLLAVVFFAIFIGVRVFAVVVVLQREGEPRLLKRLAELAYENRARLLSTIVGLQLLSLGSAAFAALKGGIPKTSPFWLDVPLANAEQRVFGVEPWQITHALLGWATPLIDHIYATFVAVHLLTVFTLIASPPSRLKGRALVCLSLCWIVLGIGAAYLLSSAGPLFYDRIFDSHRFAALNDVIRARAPLSQIVVDALWSAYKSDRGFIANGISAMPARAHREAYAGRADCMGLLHHHLDRLGSPGLALFQRRPRCIDWRRGFVEALSKIAVQAGFNRRACTGCSSLILYSPASSVYAGCATSGA